MPSAVNISPPSQLCAGPLAWVLCINLLFWGLSWGGGILATNVHVPETAQFTGFLRPDRRTTDISIPAEVPILNTQVQEGELVAIDQPLIEIDLARLRPRVERLQFEVLLNATERDCLLNQERLEEYELGVTELSGSRKLDMQTILRDCRLAHQQNQLAQATLRGQRDRLRQGVRLLRLGAKPQSPQDQANDRLRKAVEHQKLETAARAIELQLATLITRQDQQIVEKVKALRAAISIHEATLERLEPYLDQRWIRAPTPGHIAKLRVGDGPHQFSQDTVVMRLQSVVVPDLKATIVLPASLAQGLVVGDLAGFRLAALPLTSPTVPGRIETIAPAEDAFREEPMMRLTVKLQPEMIESKAERLRVSKYLSGINDPSVVEIHFEPRSVLTHLARATKSLTESFKLWSQ